MGSGDSPWDSTTFARCPSLRGPAFQTKGIQILGESVCQEAPEATIYKTGRSGVVVYELAVQMHCVWFVYCLPLEPVLNMNGFNVEMFPDFFKQPEFWQPRACSRHSDNGLDMRAAFLPWPRPCVINIRTKTKTDQPPNPLH